MALVGPLAGRRPPRMIRSRSKGRPVIFSRVVAWTWVIGSISVFAYGLVLGNPDILSVGSAGFAGFLLGRSSDILSWIDRHE